MMNKNTFLRSFTCAARGILCCVREERNFRFHLVAAAYVSVFSPAFLRTRAEGAVLALTIGLVLCTEAVNTALERAVDRVSAEQHPLAGAAKDAAAGAVLLAALAAVAVAILLFGRLSAWQALLGQWRLQPWKPVLLVLSAVPAVLFVVKPKRKESFR